MQFRVVFIDQNGERITRDFEASTPDSVRAIVRDRYPGAIILKVKRVREGG